MLVKNVLSLEKVINEELNNTFWVFAIALSITFAWQISTYSNLQIVAC